MICELYTSTNNGELFTQTQRKRQTLWINGILQKLNLEGLK